MKCREDGVTMEAGRETGRGYTVCPGVGEGHKPENTRGLLELDKAGDRLPRSPQSAQPANTWTSVKYILTSELKTGR